MTPSAVQDHAAVGRSSTPGSTPIPREDLATSLSAALARFVKRNPVSGRQHELAVQSLPGGNTRTLLHTSPFPLVMKQGKGPFLWSEDGHKYVDFVGELTAGLYGHSHPVIREAVVSTFDNVGMNLGSTIIQEQKYAAVLCERFGLDRVRFTNSGTEANIHALNGAKHFTGRSKVAVFGGAYHGAVLSFAQGKIAPNTINKDEFVVGRYNDVESAKAVIEGTPDIAAVIVEAMQGAGGCIPGEPGFLHQVQESAKRAGAVFILDEVMTSRLAPGGLQSTLGLRPDMTTLGKYLGGGFAFGAFGGRADIMAVYDPRAAGTLAHSGTFNNNTMAMYAGYSGLSRILTPETATSFSEKGQRFRKRLQDASRGTKFSFTGVGSLMMAHATETGSEDIKRGEDVAELWDLKDLFWFAMAEEGYWIHRRGSISLILDTPDDELDRFVTCFSRFLAKHESLVRVEA